MNSETIVELVISVITILSGWFIGDKNVWGQRLAVVANIGWWYYIVAYEHYGLIPMEIAFSFIVLRNLIKWEKDDVRRKRA